MLFFVMYNDRNLAQSHKSIAGLMRNNGFQESNPQETVDISCVCGVNSAIRAYLHGGENWNASPLYPKVDSIYNSTKFANSSLIGVYPYACDTCTGAKSPPECTHKDEKDKQKNAICNVQRNAKTSKGGVVRLFYKGKL